MKSEPVAIIGIGCRFPGGADSPARYWDNLTHGVDAIGEVPRDRWDYRQFYDENTDKPGKIHSNRGGFLSEDIHRFDASFFGISPREAETMDPQQKLLLEVSYEAIEDAGLGLRRLRGSDTGVFIGGFTLDNQMRLTEAASKNVDPHTAVNTTMTMLSSRISHQFGLRGPCLSIDTACSSSAVALHYACSALRNGESSLAIAGGVNVMLRPGFSVVLTKGRFLSRQGRCSFLDADADGYVRGEGAGVVILKPLSRARADGDSIYAVLRATGINHNGHTNQSISVPSADAQRELIERVYREAQIDIDEIRYVEAHGTGTQVGDATEIRALDAIFRTRSTDDKCPVGSVKTNIGHLEAAAGVASVIKAALCLHQGSIPPSLHFRRPNTQVDYDNLSLRVVQEPEDLPTPQTALIAVNGFGYGGTNAHLLLQGVEAEQPVHDDEGPSFETPILFPISGRREDAVRELAGKYRDLLLQRKATGAPAVGDVLHSLVHRRSHHDVRAAIVAESEPELLANLEIYSQGGASPAILQERIQEEPKPRLTFLFTGVGTRWRGMGKELYDTYPEFRHKLDACDGLFREIAGWSVLEEILKGDDSSWLQEVQIAQPVNFFMQVGLTELLKAHGIEPDVVLGHSLGEVSASYVAGVLSLRDAVLVSYHRSRLQRKTAGLGGMLAVQLSLSEAEEILEGYDDCSIAAINGPQSITLAGDDPSIEGIAAELAARGIFQRRLSVDIPYHSGVMQCIEKELIDSLEPLEARQPRIPIVSTVTGLPADGNDYEADYWYHNVRQPVLFQQAVQNLGKTDGVTFLEMAPYPVLRASLKQCLTDSAGVSSSLCVANKEDSAAKGLAQTVAHLHTLGRDIRWSRFWTSGSYCKLPHYPYQRNRYWRETVQQDGSASPAQPFLHTPVDAPEPAWEVELNRHHFPFMSDHRVYDKVVFPGAGYISAGVELFHEMFAEGKTCSMKNLRFHKLLIHDRVRSQTLRSSYNRQTRQLAIHCRADNEGSGHWTSHFTATLDVGEPGQGVRSLDLQEIQDRAPWKIDSKGVYDKLKTLKLDYGPAFRCIDGDVWKGHHEMLVPILCGGTEGETEARHALHPAILDACFQAIPLYCGVGLIPHSIDRLVYHSEPAARCVAYVEITRLTEDFVRGNIFLCAEDGRLMVEMQGVQGNRLPALGGESSPDLENFLYTFQWSLSEQTVDGRQTTQQQAPWLIFANDAEFDLNLVRSIEQAGMQAVVVLRGQDYGEDGPTRYRIRDNRPEDLRQLFQNLDRQRFTNILYLWNLQCRDEPTRNLMPLSWLVRQFYTSLRDQPLRWMFVTRGTQIIAPTDRTIDLDAASSWGLGRLINNEYPQITTQMVDLEALQPERQAADVAQEAQVTQEVRGTREVWVTQEVQMLVDEMLADTSEDHMALRSGQRYGGHLMRLEHRDLEHSETEAETTTLSTRSPMKIELQPREKKVIYRTSARSEPAQGEVEVHLEGFSPASALLHGDANVGEYRGDPWAECFGTVSRVGSAVDGWACGDRVLFCSPLQSLGTYIVQCSEHLVRRPDGLGHGQELMFFPFLEAIYGLQTIARLQQGETLLVVHPTSATGIAALHYARRRGATVYAAASSSAQKAFCRQLGAKVLPDAQTLPFSEWVLMETEQRGVDLIFQNLPDRISHAYIHLLAKHGKFLDCSGDVPLSQELLSDSFRLESFGFFRFCLTDIFPPDEALESTVLAALRETLALTRDSETRHQAIPVEMLPAQQAHRLFDEDSAEVQGKRAVDLRGLDVEAVADTGEPLIRADATYCITGGTGGLGWELAKWLIQSGARNLVLISRSGLKDDEAGDEVRRMQREGVNVVVERCDVGDEQALAAVFERMSRELPPLEGVFHCAMVLDDGFLMDMTPQRYDKVFHPKSDGARHLHALTEHLPLKYFVLVSSVSALIGNPGQANYVAANAYLDSLAHYRSLQGLPATSINLGPLKTFGALSRNQAVAKFLKSVGIDGFDTQQTLRGFEWVLKNTPTQIGFFDIDWHTFQKNFLHGRQTTSSIYSKIYNGKPHRPRHVDKKIAFIEELAKANGQGVLGALEARLTKEVGGLLKMDPGSLHPSMSFHSLGIDSVMTLEFVTKVETTTGYRLSTLDILSGMSIRELAKTMEALVREQNIEGLASLLPTEPQSPDGGQAVYLGNPVFLPDTAQGQLPSRVPEAM